MSLIDAVLPLCRALGASPSGLAAQMERAAISVATNIAEGYGRSSRREYLHFLAIAAGSLREIETDLLIAQRNQLLPQRALERPLALADETGRVLHGLRKSLVPKEKRTNRWPG